MAHFIQSSDNGPERVESMLKTLLVPAANFRATLTSGGATVVDLVGDDNVVYGTFNLDTLNQAVVSGLLTSLPRKIRFEVKSGTGKFNIEIFVGA